MTDVPQPRIEMPPFTQKSHWIGFAQHESSSETFEVIIQKPDPVERCGEHQIEKFQIAAQSAL